MNNDFIDLDKFKNGLFDDFSKTEIVKRETTTKIPVAILSGFLGSGKTTLLNNILRDSGLKIGIIVNDFGAINIDAKFLPSSLDTQTIELTNGCVCCIIGDNGLKEPLATLANASSDLDAIIIEASGAADPVDLIRTIRFSGNNFTYFGGNIHLIDAENFDYLASKFPSHFKKCLKTADIALITKGGRVSNEKIKSLRAEIRTHNPHAPIIESPDSTLDPAMLFSPRENWSDEIFEPHHHHHHCDKNCKHDHIHHQFSSVAFSLREPLNPRAFVDFLDNLPKNLFRAKGIIYFGMKGYEQKFRFQLVGKSIQIEAEEWQDGEAHESNLVFIGTKLDEKLLQANLNEVVDTNPNAGSSEEMVNFERFFQK